MGVTGERIVWELNGGSCLEMEDVEEPKKNIACSRSFGKLVTKLKELLEAVATYTSRAATRSVSGRGESRRIGNCESPTGLRGSQPN